MERFRTFIYILLGILLWGCDSQPLPTNLPKDIGSIRSRDALSDTTLPEGSQALFNASGGFTFANQIFAFANSRWTNAEVSLEPSNPQETTLTALYPAYNGEQGLITKNPYSGNVLEDVLIAQSNFTAPTEIELKFKHLFAMLTIHVASTIKESLTEVSLKAPKIESINGLDGSFTTSGEHTSTLPKNESGDYSFILPPMENCKLTLSFKTSDENKVSYPLTHSFISGYKYECNVIDEDTRPGIRTANDLIDFSLLINKRNSKNGTTLSDFGETIDGRTVYRLLADITLTEEQSKSLFPIGYYDNMGFKDTFDGEGHSIINLTIPDESIDSSIERDYAGLFGCIAPEGIVKNLIIEKATTCNNPTSTRSGGIAAQNKGLIINCSVQNSTFYNITKTGGICASLSSTGYIVNCYTTNNYFQTNSNTECGGLSADMAGYILNSYAYGNSYETASSSYSGGMSGQSNSGKIHNCYIFQASNPARWGAIYGINSNSTVRNFFYNNTCKYLVFKSTQTSSPNAQIYDENFQVEGIHISKLLNEWISTTGKTDFPNISFKEWKIAEDGSACFQ